MDSANGKLGALRELNFEFQDSVMDEFNRFTLQMGHVIDVERVLNYLEPTPEDLALLKPFHDYIKLSQFIFNLLINKMVVFSYQPNAIPFKYLPKKQLINVSDLIGETLSQLKQQFAECREFQSSPDYVQTAQNLQDKKIALIVQIGKLKDFAREQATHDKEATEKIKNTVFPRIAKICSEMYETISTFDSTNNKCMAAVDKVVDSQKDFTTLVGLAYLL